MKTSSDALKTFKPWQIGLLAGVLVATFAGILAIYLVVSGSGQTDLDEGQQLVPVQLGDLVNQISTNGSITYPNREDLVFNSDGTVGEVLVKEGQRIEQGDPLVTLDAATVASLEKALAQAQIDLRNAEHWRHPRYSARCG